VSKQTARANAAAGEVACAYIKCYLRDRSLQQFNSSTVQQSNNPIVQQLLLSRYLARWLIRRLLAKVRYASGQDLAKVIPQCFLPYTNDLLPSTTNTSSNNNVLSTCTALIVAHLMRHPVTTTAQISVLPALPAGTAPCVQQSQSGHSGLRRCTAGKQDESLRR
jgi:hypothetical protein